MFIVWKTAQRNIKGIYERIFGVILFSFSFSRIRGVVKVTTFVVKRPVGVMSHSSGKASASKQRGTAASPLESPESGTLSARLSFENVVRSPESQVDPGPLGDPSSSFPCERPSTRSSSVQRPADEPLEELHEEEDERSASEQDGDLLDASFAGESVPGTTRPVETVDLVDLQGWDKCRQIYIGRLSDGSKACLC
jgi:hypothetical protein